MEEEVGGVFRKLSQWMTFILCVLLTPSPVLPLHPSITKQRTEVVFEGTRHHNPESPAAVWEEYEFKCKPGRLDRTPCLISPYHYRLDWLMWFAAFQVCFLLSV